MRKESNSYTAIVLFGLLILVFLGGLLFGSFLNVFICRIPRDQSIVSPRSRCVACGHALRWFDNVPLLSYAALRGRCRDCHTAISWHYPAVELAFGMWCVACAWPVLQLAGFTSDAGLRVMVHQFALIVFGFFALGLMVIDWQHLRLPNVLTIPGTLTGLLFVCTEALFLRDGEYDLVLQRRVNINAANSGHSTGNVFLTGPEHLVFGRLLAVVACFLLLYTIGALYRVLRRRDGMGMGDARLLAMIAAFLGFAPTVVAFAAGVLLATVWAVVLLTRSKVTAATRLPFGSFLAAGGLFAAFFGERLAGAYLALLR